MTAPALWAKAAGVCHYDMGRRWTGSALIEDSPLDAQIDWRGTNNIARQWGERGWCAECGSGLFFRVTAENEFAGGDDTPRGLLDDPNGSQITHKIHIDHGPDSFAYAGKDGRMLLTRADCVTKFSPLDSAQARSKP